MVALWKLVTFNRISSLLFKTLYRLALYIQCDSTFLGSIAHPRANYRMVAFLISLGWYTERFFTRATELFLARDATISEDNIVWKW